MPQYLGTDDSLTSVSTLQDFAPTGWQKMNAAVREAWLESYGPVGLDYLRSVNADDKRKITAAEAESMRMGIGGGARVSIKPKDNEYTAGQWTTILERQRELAAIKDVRERTPWELGSVLRGGAMFGAGIVDPINLATAFVPWTKSVSALRSVRAAAASESFLTRTGARAILGGADAGISTAVLEPLFYAGRQALGDDYTAMDSLANIAFGTAFGGGLHVIGGSVGDAFSGRFRRAAPAVEAPPMAETGALNDTPTVVDMAPVRTITPEAERVGMPEVKGEPEARIENVPEKVQKAVDEQIAKIQQAGENAAARAVDAAPASAAPTPDTLLTIPAPGKRNDLLAAIKRAGGISTALAREATGENGMRLNRSLPGLVRKEGGLLQYDQAAQLLADDGFLTPGIDPLSYEAAAEAEDLISRALNGERILRWEDRMAEDMAARDMAALDPAPATDVMQSVDPETREATLRAAVAQAADGRAVDVEPIVGLDESLGTHTIDDVAGAADRNFAPESQPLADFEVSRAVDERNAAAPKWDLLEAADQALIEADALLADTVMAGDEAYKYSRQKAFHGTPHRGIAKFSTDKIGTGEGAQAYGWGLYFASMRDIAEHYRRKLTGVDGKPIQIDDSGLIPRQIGSSVVDALDRVDREITIRKTNIENAKDNPDVISPDQVKRWEAELRAYEARRVEIDQAGQLYQVEIPTDDTMLLWDKPLSEQPEGVRKAILATQWIGASEPGLMQMTGEKLYHAMSRRDGSRIFIGDDKFTSNYLAGLGIKGIKYLDGTSRGAGDGSFNYVVFSGDDVSITATYYSRGITGQPAADLLNDAIRTAFGDSTDALLASGRVKIVASVTDIPDGPHPGDVKAATAPDGTVYIVADNVSPAEAKGMLLHEVGVHVGMEAMVGPEVFGSLLAELDAAILAGESWAQKARAAVPADTPAYLVHEEQLAYLVQNAPELPIVQRIIAAVRAWAYRTFEAARTRMTLTEADFRAMAAAALHAAARDTRAAGDAPGVRYSRGETPDPSTAQDELKPADEAVARAKQFAGVLRAAADKLANDADAAAAMRAAMPDITKQEIDSLLGQLRKEVKGLRGMARTSREMLTAEDRAAVMQPDAMLAADRLANNLQMAAIIERRNLALNQNARLRASSFLNQFRKPGLDFEGFRALLVGSERKRDGARLSVDAEQKNFRGEWLGGMIADLEKNGTWQAFTSGQFDRDVYVALHAMGKGEQPAGVAPEAVKIAEVVNKYQEDARNTRNRFGAWIRDLSGYITRQTHDTFKIRDAGQAEWVRTVLPLLDIPKMQRLGLISEVDPARSLADLYGDFAAGRHMKVPAGEDDMAAFGAGRNLAKRESQSRALYFKDGDAAFQYNTKFGQGRLAETVLQGLDGAAKSAGLLKVLGTNPEATLDRLFMEYEDSLRGDPERRAKFASKKGELRNLLATLDGTTQIPGDVQAAKIAAFTRAWVAMSKLGGMLISSITDLSNYAAEMRFGQDQNLLGGVLDGMGALTRGRAKGEQKQILASLGVFHESMLGGAYHRFDNPDLVGGKTAWAMQQFFKWTGINWWTETLRDAYALSHSHYMASNAGKAFDALPDSLRDMLGLYKIDAGKWELLRNAPMQAADGRNYMTPEGVNTLPRQALENYIASVGRTVSDASVQNLRDDLASALRAMTIDRMHHAVIEPGARTRAFMQRGTQPGTVAGEFLRYIGQFKSFPVALIQMTLGREVYGRGYDTIGEYLRKGRGDMLGLASFIALSVGMGYAAMSIKDLLRGKNPRPIDDRRTWMAAFVQGGGLGIYGDFLFGQYSRTGGTLTASLAGPAFGVLDTVMDLKTRIQKGDDVAAAAFKAALDNTPFMNIFYTRVALDYLILHQIQEALNPGFLRRAEQRVQRDNGQTYWLPPSEVAR